GSMGQAHAAGWEQTDAEVVGVLANEAASATALAERLGGRPYSNFDALLGDVDVIDICAPTHLHREMTEKAAATGKHIFCEKPIALTVADGEAMIAACEAAGVRLFVGMVLHFFPEYIAMKDVIAAGQIGAPKVIRMTRASYRPQKAADNWFMDEAKSGGMMIDLMIHDFEMARWLAGGEVQRVYAKSVRGENPEADIDHALAILRFDNGAMAHIEGSWAYPYPMFSVRAEVAGENSLIEWDSEKSAPIAIHTHRRGDDAAGDVALPLSPLSQDPWASEVVHFYEAIINDTPFRVTAQDALRGLQIALAAKASVQTGQPITLSTQEGE
ncbi:MAG: Gfo/Idh/MocA family oxidoreductase, partial [Chloroflexota bacterium]